MTSNPCILLAFRVLMALTGFFLFSGVTVASSASGQVSSPATLSPFKVKSGATFKGTASTGKSFKATFSVPTLRNSPVRTWQVSGSVPTGLMISSGVKKSGVIVANTTRLTFSGKPVKSGIYSLRLNATYSNGRKVSANYTLTVKEPVKFLQQPISKSVPAGGTVTLEAKASGYPQPSYQWYKGSAKLSGKTSAKLTLSNVATSASGKYHVVATNSSGAVKSSVITLTVSSYSPGSSIVVSPPPLLNPPPSSVVISSGSLSVSGSATLGLGGSSNYSSIPTSVILTGGTLFITQHTPIVFRVSVPDQTHAPRISGMVDYAYTGFDLPLWLSVDPFTGVLIASPSESDAGTYSITVSATKATATLTTRLDIVVE
jgi:hypothetical protein